MILGIFIVFLYALPLFQTKFNLGNAFGICLGFLIAAVGSLFDYAISLPLWLKIIVCTSFLSLVVIYSVTIALVIKSSKITATNESIVIVLGCRVKWDRPSLALIERCNAAYRHLAKNPTAVAILSGGQGKDESMTEARCMFNLLCGKGIDPKRLYLEEKSTSTVENILLSKKIIEENKLSGKIALATSEYHLFRARLIAQRCGVYPALLPAHTVNYAKLPFYTREVLGIWAMLLKLR